MITMLLIVAVALLWGGWPLVARSAGEGNSFNTLVLILASVAPIAVLASLTSDKKMVAETTRMTFAPLGIAGMMMGLGLIAFNSILANKDVEISAVVPVINVSMMTVTVIGGVWFFGESMTPAKVIGILFLITGIVLLRPTGT